MTMSDGDITKQMRSADYWTGEYDNDRIFRDVPGN